MLDHSLQYGLLPCALVIQHSTFARDKHQQGNYDKETEELFVPLSC